MSKYSKEKLRHRACERVAMVLQGCWEERGGSHSRLFEVLVKDWLVEDGVSVKGEDYREHVVPCVLILNECTKMFENKASIEEVTLAILKHLRIVRISKEEAKHLDTKLGLKTKMPDWWVFGKDDPLARLTEAKIVLVGEEACE